MINLVGSYECKVDAKCRLMLPSDLKKQLDKELSKGFVLKKNEYQQSLDLYPMDEWEKVAKKLNELNQFTKQTQDFIRKFTSGFRKIEADNVGRILIPKDLASFAEIKNDLVVSANGHKVEIMSKEKYDETINNPAIDFAAIANKLFGSPS